MTTDQKVMIEYIKGLKATSQQDAVAVLSVIDEAVQLLLTRAAAIAEEHDVQYHCTLISYQNIDNFKKIDKEFGDDGDWITSTMVCE